MKQYEQAIPRPDYWPAGTVCLADAIDIVFAQIRQADPRLYVRRKLAKGLIVAELNCDGGERHKIPASYWGGPAGDDAFRSAYPIIEKNRGAVIIDRMALAASIEEWRSVDGPPAPVQMTEAERIALIEKAQKGGRSLGSVPSSGIDDGYDVAIPSPIAKDVMPEIIDVEVATIGKETELRWAVSRKKTWAKDALRKLFETPA